VGGQKRCQEPYDLRFLTPFLTPRAAPEVACRGRRRRRTRPPGAAEKAEAFDHAGGTREFRVPPYREGIALRVNRAEAG